jgi:hypothetical protein
MRKEETEKEPDESLDLDEMESLGLDSLETEE